MSDEASQPEFGPGGYLPPKASQRARKIVLREQMGFGWPLAAAGAALLVAIAGAFYLATASRPPGAPYVSLGPFAEVDASGAAVLDDGAGNAALVVRAGGPPRVFLAEQTVAWCATSGRLEGGGAAWSSQGQLVYGEGESLQPLRSVVFDGVVYADFTTPQPKPAPAPNDVPPACASGD